MADLLTWEALRRVATTVAAAVWKRILPIARRLRAARQAAGEGTIPADPLEASIGEAIEWLVGEARDDSLLGEVKVRGGHAVVAVGIFRKPAVREWLCRHDVKADLRHAARHGILYATAPAAGPSDATLAAYEKTTGEHRRSGETAFSQAVAVIVASVRSSLNTDSAIAAAASHHQGNRIVERIDQLEQRSALLPSVAVAGAASLSARVQVELDRLLARRSVVPEGETREALRSLSLRVEQGDLRGAPASTLALVLWWSARFAASDPGSDYDVLIAQARAQDPTSDFRVHEALRQSALGHTDAALQILRARDDSDALSVLISVLAKAGRRADAIAWLGDIDALAPNRLTSVGWRNLASMLIEEDRYSDAARILARCTLEHEAECPDILYVRGLARAASLYPDYAREALRYGIVPIPVAMREGPEADAMHGAAVADLQRASTTFDALGLKERGRNAHVCALALRLGYSTTRDDARSDLAGEMMGPSSPPLDLISLALEHGVAFDREGVAARLTRAERLGELNPQETEARIALLQHQDPAQLATYLEARATTLTGSVTEARVAGLRVEALARSGDVVRARQVLTDVRDLLGDDHDRLSALVDAHAGLDPTEALARLAQTTGAPLDLENLCRALERARNWAALVSPARELAGKVPNTENLLRVVVALQRSRASDTDVLAALDQYPELTSGDRRLSVARAHALLGAGSITTAVTEARALYAAHGGAEEAVAACNAALLCGDWAALREIAARETERRGTREPAHLAWLGKVCSEQDEGAALILVREAAGREDAGAVTLLRCADVALRAGADEEAFGWIRRAHDLSGEAGPVQMLEQSRAVSVLVERAEQSRSIGGLLSSGQIPLHLAAEALGIGLARLLLHNLIMNARQPDGRRRSILPLRPGSRPLSPPSGVRRPIVDITSLLLLAHLDALPLLDRAFDEVVLPWSTMVMLRQEADRLRHHQRSMVLQAQRLRDLLAAGVLKRLLPWQGRPDRSIENEVGPELAQLLARAHEVGGRVVHTAAISRVAGEDGARADLGDLGQIILTTRQFADMLRAHGALDRDRHATAMAVLQQHDAGSPLGPSYTGGPLFISWLAVAYLQPLGLLDALQQTDVTAFVSDDVAEGALAHNQHEADAAEMAVDLRRVREWYAAALAVGRVRVAARLRGIGEDEEEDDERGSGRLLTLKEFLLAPECDGALIDDRYLLRHANLERAGASLPLFGTLDLLRHLAGGPLLATEQHWVLRHRLRAGGAACVPLDPEELRHHLAHLSGDEVGESAELRAIRESAAALLTRDVLVLPEEEPFLSALLLAACIAIRQIWADEDLTTEVARRQADWAWDHVVPKAPDWWHRLREDSRPAPTAEVLRAPLVLLLPLFVTDPERRRAARSWLEERLLVPWWTDLAFRKLAGDVARAHIVEFSERLEGDLPRGDVAEELIIRLPPVVAAELRGDAEFLEASGLRDRLPLAGVGPDLIFALPAMRSAARSALNGQSATVRDLRNNRDVRFTAKHGRLMMNWEADEEMQEREAPVDAALLSPCAAERMEAFGQLVADAGPSGPDPVRWRPVLEAAELSDGDLDMIMEEVANAVPIRLARTANALSRGVLDLRLMVPSDLRYWEGLCGGAPGAMTQAEWLAAVWQPRAAHLLTTFGAEGFRLIAAANGRPGFIDSAASPSVEVLEELAAEAQSDWGPLARLAIVEAATDHVGGDFVGRAASRLVLDLAEAEGEAALRLEVFAGLFRLLGAALLVSPCMAGQPPYWVRLCALAQADLLVGPVLAVQPDVPKLLKVMRELAPAGGHWAELLSLREEPLWRPEMASADWLRAEVLGRLTALLAQLGDAEAAERAAAATAEAGRASGYPPAGFSPGPLECAALPPGGAGSVPDLVNSVDAALQAIEGSTSVPVAWRFLDMASRHIQLDEVHLGKLASLAEGWSPVGESGELRWLPLMHLARAAASQRDAELAEKILRTIRATPEAGVEAGSALQIALAASAAWPLIDEAVAHFAETALSVAWRAKRDGCVEIEAVLGSVADRLPLGASWRLSLPRIVAELGAHARGG